MRFITNNPLPPSPTHSLRAHGARKLLERAKHVVEIAIEEDKSAAML